MDFGPVSRQLVVRSAHHKVAVVLRYVALYDVRNIVSAELDVVGARRQNELVDDARDGLDGLGGWTGPGYGRSCLLWRGREIMIRNVNEPINALTNYC